MHPLLRTAMPGSAAFLVGACIVFTLSYSWSLSPDWRYLPLALAYSKISVLEDLIGQLLPLPFTWLNLTNTGWLGQGVH